MKDLAIDFLYYFLASRAEIDSIIFDIFSSAFASFAFSASISCSGAFGKEALIAELLAKEVYILLCILSVLIKTCKLLVNVYDIGKRNENLALSVTAAAQSFSSHLSVMMTSDAEASLSKNITPCENTSGCAVSI